MDVEIVALRATLESKLASAGVPGAVLAVARDGAAVQMICVGADASGEALTPNSLFPVASVTKLATALAVLRLVDRGDVGLDAPFGQYLPEAASAQPGVTVRALLAHVAGLPLDLPPEAAPYGPGLSWSALAEACRRCALAEEPGTRVQYSNVGYGLLGMIVERRMRQSIGDALQTLVLAPLGIEGSLGGEPARRPALLADVRGRHARTEMEPFNSAFWRHLSLPWAGLVTTAGGALALVRAFTGVPGDFLSERTRAEAVRDQTSGLAGGMAPPLVWDPSPWGLGPELRDAKSPHWAPREASPASFGHAGASGCYVWADPTVGVAWALLGARTADTGWLLRSGAAIGAAVLAGV